MRAHSTLSWLSVFTSGSTLVCCALPALLVAIGAGAALSGLVSAIPQLVWLSEHKGAVFGIAGLMLAGSGWLQWRSRKALECPPDASLAAACATTKDVSLRVWLASVAIYLVGAFFAFAAPLLI
ncbi:MAG TPA: hypothetical protein VM140_07460 [Burkholderiales bacterium]|nr:hypothetical protein [Burkholderiales bacterium]